MQFKVPQFLDIEDKIFGPFTFKQFVYLVGGGGFCFILYKWLGFLLGAIPILIIAALALALTFYRPNNKPFVLMLESGIKYFTQSKLYIWKKEGQRKPSVREVKLASGEGSPGGAGGGAKLDGSRLRDLAWSLDVLDLKKENTGG